MRFTLGAALALALCVPIQGQTTGFPGINDYTVNGVASGSTSCTFVLATGLPMTFTVTAPPSTPVIFLFNTCPCRPGYFPLAPVVCPFPIFQSIDIPIGAPGCLNLSLTGFTNTAGVASFTLPPCASPFRFSTQAVVLSCPPYVVTQAYQVSC